MRTEREIIRAARHLLRQTGDFSIRSVGAEIGLSSQGMYRYVESAEELRALVAEEILDAVLAYMGEAADRYSLPQARIAASSVAFRTWALANRNEFRHVFTASFNMPRSQDPLNSAQRVGAYFAPLFAQLQAETGFQGPAQIDPKYAEFAREQLSKGPYLELPGADDLGVLWVFQYVWTRLYGIVAMEAFHQVDEQNIESGLFFRVTLSEVAQRLGIDQEALLDEVFEAERRYVGENPGASQGQGGHQAN
ncbi:MAG: TetR/AcrR family transcriptional regulator [Propionibacteriaceae bacterium]|nr:TetR/AcrR family transcriptional regulator [Propionibacteriaceae bacterium]